MVEILSFIQYSCPKACEVCYKNRFDISHVTLISDCNCILVLYSSTRVSDLPLK